MPLGRNWRQDVDTSSARIMAESIFNEYNKNKNYDNDQSDAYMNNLLQMIMRDEDFARSSPQQQVQRLMAAGMSRAAALQALGEQQYGNAQTGIAGNSEQNALAKSQQVFDIIQASIQLLNQGVQFGFAVPALVTQIQGLQYSQQLQHNVLLRDNISTQIAQDQYGALAETAEFQQMFYNYSKQTGEPLPPNLSDMVQCLSDIDKDANPQYFGFDEKWKAAISKPFFFATMSKAYADMVRADYSVEVAKRHAIAGAILAEYATDIKADELARSHQELFEFLQNSVYREKDTKTQSDILSENLTNIRLRNAGQRTINKSQDALFDYEWSQGKHAERDNLELKLLDYSEKVAALDFEVKSEYITPLRQKQLQMEMNKLNEYLTSNPDYAKHYAQQMVDNQFLRETMLSNVKMYFDYKGLTTTAQQGYNATAMRSGDLFYNNTMSNAMSFMNMQPVNDTFSAMDALGLVPLLLQGVAK